MNEYYNKQVIMSTFYIIQRRSRVSYLYVNIDKKGRLPTVDIKSSFLWLVLDADKVVVRSPPSGRYWPLDWWPAGGLSDPPP